MYSETVKVLVTVKVFYSNTTIVLKSIKYNLAALFLRYICLFNLLIKYIHIYISHEYLIHKENSG